MNRPPAPDPKLLMRRATELHQEGHLAEAEQFYRELMTLEPGAAGPHYLFGVLALQQGRNAEALAALETAVTLQPDHAAAWSNRGTVLRNLKRHQDALLSFDRALALKPDLPATLYNRANILLQEMRQPEKALPAYERVVVLNPGFAEAWNNRGAALCMLDRLPEALESFGRALVLRPNFAEGLNCRGLALLASHRTDEALADFRRAAELAYGTEQSPLQGAPPGPAWKQRHDREQHDYQQAIRGRFPSKAGARIAGPAVTPGNTAAGGEWRSRNPKLAVIDNLLTPEALEGLRRFCHEEPVWRAAHDDGYLGAFPEHGFACPLLGQIAEELRAAFPDIFRAHSLRYLWGFKYDSTLPGVKIHADEAAVNVNFWITPDEANLDPEGGGLIVWDVPAPLELNFPIFGGDIATTRAFLAKAGAKPTKVPYRANRAVMFDSDLFHETDKVSFKDGYLNRRINIAVLYGLRHRDHL